MNMRLMTLPWLMVSLLLVGGCASTGSGLLRGGPLLDETVVWQRAADRDTAGRGASLPSSFLLEDASVATVWFQAGQSSLTDTTIARLEEIAKDLRRASGKVLIIGYSDPGGSREYNLALGEERAKAVARHLDALGIRERRRTLLSYGEDYPAVQGTDEQARARNRRVEISARL